MRTKGSKNKRPTFITFERLNKKAKKAETVLIDMIEKSLTNGYFNKLVDYNLLNNAIDHLKELSTIKNDP